MAIARWAPFDELTNLHTTMDRLFGDLFENGRDTGGNMTPTFRLPVDISENDNAYVIQAPVAGFKPEEVEVSVMGNVLTIRAEHREEKEDKKENYLRREIVYGDMVRQIALPNDARADNINASFDNGVLKIEVPRAPRAQPKRIEVRSQDQNAQGRQTGQGQKTENQKADGQKQMAGSSASTTQSNR
jgi:HSP20 family protein